MNKFFTLIVFALLSMMAYAQEGAWSGELDLGSTKLPLVFHFDPDGCTLDSPAQGARGIKAQLVKNDNGSIKVMVPSLMASYEGVYVMNVIAGTFTQNGASLPLTLKPGENKPRRPQTPQPPFPYTTEEVSFSHRQQDVEYVFHGTITLPEGYTRNTPALVMVTGSGQQNRDEEMIDHRPFAVIADALARQGIATLRFDDRGYDDPAFPVFNFTIDDHVLDAAAAVDALRQRFDRVGVIGHSEGGTIALMLASEGKVDFGVSLAGMAVSGKETLLDQNRIQLSSAGLPESDVDAFCQAMDKAFDHVAAGGSVSLVDDTLVPDMLKPNFQAAMQQLELPYIRAFVTHDIRASLPKVTCPILALNGSRDTQVNCTRNLEAIDKGLVNSQHQVVALEGLNHLFQHCQTGLQLEYLTIEETFAPEALQQIAAWVLTVNH